MNDKERFRAAIETLRSATKALPVEQRSPAINAADTVERFAGELRRQSSVLKREVEATRNDLAEMKRRVNQGASELAKHDQRAEEQRKEVEKSLRDAFRPGIRLPSGARTEAKFVVIKAKCLACSLHFLLATERPERHSNETLHCPECGHHAGEFFVWRDEVHGFIFELVPGRSQFIGHP